MGMVAEIMQGRHDLEICRDRGGYQYWTGWYVLMPTAMPIAGMGSLVLSCTARNSRRWKLSCRQICCFCCGRKVANVGHRGLLSREKVEVKKSVRSSNTEVDSLEQNLTFSLNQSLVSNEESSKTTVI